MEVRVPGSRCQSNKTRARISHGNKHAASRLSEGANCRQCSRLNEPVPANHHDSTDDITSGRLLHLSLTVDPRYIEVLKERKRRDKTQMNIEKSRNGYKKAEGSVGAPPKDHMGINRVPQPKRYYSGWMDQANAFERAFATSSHNTAIPDETLSSTLVTDPDSADTRTVLNDSDDNSVRSETNSTGDTDHPN